MGKLLKTSLILLALLVLAMGPHIGGPVVRAEDDTRSERSDLDLSRDDRGELWDEDSHEVSREHRREREGHRETDHDREMERDREREQEHDSIREQFRDHDMERDSISDRENHDD